MSLPYKYSNKSGYKHLSYWLPSQSKKFTGIFSLQIGTITPNGTVSILNSETNFYMNSTETAESCYLGDYNPISYLWWQSIYDSPIVNDGIEFLSNIWSCLLYTSDAADE